jgi:hypothetical protein
MVTVAEGVVLGACVIDAHPAMRRNVIPTKVGLMRLVFMISRFLIGFTGIIFPDVSHAFATPMRECL